MSFNFSASTANAVFYRSYSRRQSNGFREDWNAVTDRTLQALTELGSLNSEEYSLIYEMQSELKTLPSGRWLWVGGSDWSKNPKNFSGSYNCTGTNLDNIKVFGMLMNLAMQGSGTGAVVEPKYIELLPAIKNRLNVKVIGNPGDVQKEKRVSETSVNIYKNRVNLIVGDSRNGWVTAYQSLLELASSEAFEGEVSLVIDVSNVRAKGEKLKGFGGTANPAKLPELFVKVANILNKAVGRQLTSVECCLLLDEAAVTIVAGNIRRSAGIRQFDSNDVLAAVAKDNLWQQDSEGNWRIDPERDALRMANHTRVYHHKPTFEEVLESISKQFYSGEGAIQYAPEAIVRANADLLNTEKRKNSFIASYEQNRQAAREYLRTLAYKNNVWLDDKELDNRMSRYSLNPCGEIIGSDFHCNLSEIHLNQLDPFNFEEQAKAFKAGAISAAVLLHHKFEEPRYQYSREIDPIVGVSFTGLFDFFVKAFGADWLRWWQAGRTSEYPINNYAFSAVLAQILEHFILDVDFECVKPGYWNMAPIYKAVEKAYLTFWKQTVEQTVKEYCEKHNLRVPNRCTTVQPAGSKSLLTGASSGWHPPKAARYIRRITFAKDDAIALALMDYGYSVVPSQSDKDENGVLLNDPFDPRCTEWLVEIPVAVSWADLPGCDQVDISKFSIEAQYDFYMQVQRFYTTHNTSATLEIRENEIETLAKLIHNSIENDEGYVSAAILARFDSLETFPRLPFEPIGKEVYEQLSKEVLLRRKGEDFHQLLSKYDNQELEAFNQGSAACDSDKCMLPLTDPNKSKEPFVFKGFEPVK